MSNHNEKYEKLAQVIREHREQKGALMPVLQAAQNIFGCVPLDVQEIIADGLGVTLSEVYGVATFYSQFSLQPKGEYVCGVCLGTACYVKGSQKVLDKLCSELGVEVGQTSKDGTLHRAGNPLPGRVWPGARHDDQRRGIRPPDAGGHSRTSWPSTAPRDRSPCEI